VDKVNEGAVAVLLLGLLVWLLKKIIWDWIDLKTVRKGEYVPAIKFEEHLKDHHDAPFLTVQAFNDHRKECCAIGLKRDFNACKQESCTDQAKNESRLSTIEDRLREGQVTFQSLNEKMDEKFDVFSDKFDKQNQILARIQTVLEFALERKERGEI